MKRLLILFLYVFLTACGPASKPVSTRSTLPIEISTITPMPLQTPQATLSIVPFSSPQSNDVLLETITSFAQMPGNLAKGQPAPDFSARLLGGDTFVLSKEQGKYWLVIPTAIGCGECEYSLSLLRQAQPRNPASLHVLVLDIYQPDLPTYWQSYADASPNYLYAVVDTPSFMEDYNLYGLGAFLVIDTDGRLVFQSDSAPSPEYITHLFKLAQGEKTK